MANTKYKIGRCLCMVQQALAVIILVGGALAARECWKVGQQFTRVHEYQETAAIMFLAAFQIAGVSVIAAVLLTLFAHVARAAFDNANDVAGMAAEVKEMRWILNRLAKRDSNDRA